MKVWKLSPKGQHAEAKTGYLRIRAHSELRAREIAEETFENSKVNTMHALNWSILNWFDKNAVECLLEEEDISTTEGILDIE